MNKEDVIYMKWSTTLLLKNEILSFATMWKDLESIILSEKSEAEKDKCLILLFICGIEKIKLTNIYNKTERDSSIKRIN